MPRGHYLDGNVLRDTPNQRAAKIRSAEARRCPQCGRKSALSTYREDWGGGAGITVRACRWCDYTRKRLWEPEGA